MLKTSKICLHFPSDWFIMPDYDNVFRRSHLSIISPDRFGRANISSEYKWITLHNVISILLIKLCKLVAKHSRLPIKSVNNKTIDPITMSRTSVLKEKRDAIKLINFIRPSGPRFRNIEHFQRVAVWNCQKIRHFFLVISASNEYFF